MHDDYDNHDDNVRMHGKKRLIEEQNRNQSQAQQQQQQKY